MWPDKEQAEILYPDNRYRVDFGGPCFRRVDKVAWPIMNILRLMPEFTLERLRDVIETSVGGENGIVVIITDVKVELRLVTFEWPGHAPVLTSELWKELTAEEVLALSSDDLINLICEGLRLRLQARKKCKFCENIFPPEFGDISTEKRVEDGRRVLEEVWACHSCQEKYLGIDH